MTHLRYKCTSGLNERSMFGHFDKAAQLSTPFTVIVFFTFGSPSYLGEQNVPFFQSEYPVIICVISVK